MQRYHAEHQDPEALGHSSGVCTLRCLKTATIQWREELHPAAVCSKALNTAEIQSLDSIQPEHAAFHKQSGEQKILAWSRCSRLCLISHTDTLVGAQPPPLAAFNFGFNLDCISAFLHTRQSCPLLFNLVSPVPSATVNGKFALQTNR